MNKTDLKDRNIESEMVFTASRSSGPGGQNVNKVSTRVELRFNVMKSLLLSDDEKQLIIKKLSRHINSVGELIIVSQSERTQLKNKKKAIDKFFSLLSKTLIRKPTRIPTFPTEKSKEKRLQSKRIRSAIKRTRNNPEQLQAEQD
jgi:ribosome-associated protein